MALGSAASMAGCTGGGDGDGDGDGDTPASTPTATATPGLSERLEDVKIGVGTWEVSAIHAATGLHEILPDKIGWQPQTQVIDGSDILTQAILSGNVDAGNFGSSASLAASQRIPFRAFHGYIKSSDYVLVTQSHIESLQDIMDKEASIGVNSFVGPSSLQVFMSLLNGGVITEDEIPQVQEQMVRVGFSGSRQAAMIAGDIDVSTQHWAQWVAMRGEGDFNKLVEFAADLDTYLASVYSTRQQTLDEKTEELSYVCEGLMLGARAMYNDFDYFVDSVRTWVPGGGPDRATLEVLYEYYNTRPIWSVNGALTEESMQAMIDISATVGIIDEPIPVDEAMDPRPLNMALDRIGEVDYPFE